MQLARRSVEITKRRQQLEEKKKLLAQRKEMLEEKKVELAKRTEALQQHQRQHLLPQSTSSASNGTTTEN